MKFVLTFVALFVVIGIAAPAFTKQVYSLMVSAIVVVIVVFYVLWFR
jgi:hypothetical protein